MPPSFSSGSTARGSFERASPSATPSKYGSLSRASAWRSSVANARSRASSAMRPPPISAPSPSSAALVSARRRRVGAFRRRHRDHRAQRRQRRRRRQRGRVVEHPGQQHFGAPRAQADDVLEARRRRPVALQHLQAGDIEARGRLGIAERGQRARRADAAHPRLGHRLLHLALRSLRRRSAAPRCRCRPRSAASRRPTSGCCALSRMRCIVGVFIIPAAPRIVSVSGFVCRPSARFSCATAVARCCSVRPAAPSAARNSAAMGWTTLSSARLAEELVQRLGARRDRQQCAAGGDDDACGPWPPALLVEIVQIRHGGGFLGRCSDPASRARSGTATFLCTRSEARRSRPERRLPRCRRLSIVVVVVAAAGAGAAHHAAAHARATEAAEPAHRAHVHLRALHGDVLQRDALDLPQALVLGERRRPGSACAAPAAGLAAMAGSLDRRRRPDIFDRAHLVFIGMPCMPIVQLDLNW